MSNLTVNSGIDIDTSINSFIPTAAIISVAGDMTQLSSQYSNIDQTGLCPCDGRALNTYTYRELHKVISNIYGGTAYSAGTTDQSGATTTFNVPLLFASSELSYAPYTRGAGTGFTLGQKTNATHSHTTDTGTSTNLATANINHSHSGNINVNNVGSTNHYHSSPGSSPNSGWADVGAAGKSDGTATAAGNGHSHNGTYFAASGVTDAGGDHSHTAITVTSNAENIAHSHTLSIPGYNSPVESLPKSVSAIYFIKI